MNAVFSFRLAGKIQTNLKEASEEVNRDLLLGLAMLGLAAVLVAYGQLLVRQGWEARSASPNRTFPPPVSIQDQAVLTPEQESLLGAVDRHQLRLTAKKLIIARNGDVLTGDDQAKSTGANLVQELFGTSPPPAGGADPRFVALVESLPTRYIRFFPEARYGDPFVVTITDEGRRHLAR